MTTITEYNFVDTCYRSTVIQVIREKQPKNASAYLVQFNANQKE